MAVRAHIIALLGLLVTSVAACTPAPAPPPPPAIPTSGQMLHWTQAERDYGFANIDRLPKFNTATVSRGSAVMPLPKGAPLDLIDPATGKDFDLDAFMTEQNGIGIIILVNGELRADKYYRGFRQKTRWMTASVTKSINGMLTGIALERGEIPSINEPVRSIIPELRRPTYTGVTVRHLLEMRSGVDWRETPYLPNSHVFLCSQIAPQPDEEAIVTCMKRLGQRLPPGGYSLYSSGDAALLGVVNARSTKTPLSDYLSSELWQSIGMEDNALWLLDQSKNEIGSCCLFARLTDWARFGQFVVDGGAARGVQIVPRQWIDDSLQSHQLVSSPAIGRGYARQWWTYADGSAEAKGAFGQSILVDRTRRLVVVIGANYPDDPTRQRTLDDERVAFFALVQSAIDREAGVRPRPTVR